MLVNNNNNSMVNSNNTMVNNNNNSITLVPSLPTQGLAMWVLFGEAPSFRWGCGVACLAAGLYTVALGMPTGSVAQEDQHTSSSKVLESGTCGAHTREHQHQQQKHQHQE